MILSRATLSIAVALFIALGGVGVGQTEAPAQELTTADQVMERFLEVMGGRELLQKIHQRHLVATVEAQGMAISIESWEAAPAESYAVMEIPGLMTRTTGITDGVAWSSDSMTGPRLLDGKEKAQALREAVFHKELQYKERFEKRELVGTETFGGETCYHVVMTPEKGEPEHWLFSQKTGLQIGLKRVVRSEMGVVPVEMLLKDWKSVDGILQPHLMETSEAGMKGIIKVKKLEHDFKMPEGRFEAPPEVQKLIGSDKPKAQEKAKAPEKGDR